MFKRLFSEEKYPNSLENMKKIKTIMSSKEKQKKKKKKKEYEKLLKIKFYLLDILL